MKNIRRMLGAISVYNAYVLIFCLLFFIQKFTLGLLPFLKGTVIFNSFYLGDVLFCLTSVVFIKLYVRAYPTF